MMQFGLIGIGAGAAAALLFASVTSGAWLSIPLFYLAPLPIMIAGLGWSHWAALTAALTGALALGIAFGPVFFFTFLAGAGLPAWWLATSRCWRVRPATARQRSNGIRPAGWWSGRRVLAGLVVVVAIPNFGIDGESFRAGLRNALDAYSARGNGGAGGCPAQRSRRRPMPAGSSTSWWPPSRRRRRCSPPSPTCSICGSPAAIVKFSGLLKRPWPPLAAMTFPRALTAALALAVVLSFVGGLVGIVAGVLSASLLMAYGVLGFAVLHAITQGMDARIFLLGGVYAAVLVFGWPVLALCLLGLIETVIDLRARVARKRGPPAHT